MKLKCVRNFRHANSLLELGHRLVRIDLDKRDKNFTIYLFEVDKTIHSDLKKLEGK